MGCAEASLPRTFMTHRLGEHFQLDFARRVRR
jgi:hypothetical protein